MDGPKSKKRKEPPKRVNHKKDIKFLNLFLSSKTYQLKKGEELLKGCLS
jgi:hypothetical protein